MSQNPRYHGYPGYGGSRNEEQNGNGGYGDAGAWNNRVVVDNNWEQHNQQTQPSNMQPQEAYQPNMALNPMFYQQMNAQGQAAPAIVDFPQWLDALDQEGVYTDQAQFMGMEQYAGTSAAMQPGQMPPGYGIAPNYPGTPYTNQQQQALLAHHHQQQQQPYCPHQQVPPGASLGNQQAQVQHQAQHRAQAASTGPQNPYAMNEYAMQQQVYAGLSPQQMQYAQQQAEASTSQGRELTDEAAITFAHEALMEQGSSEAYREHMKKKNDEQAERDKLDAKGFTSYTEAGGVLAEALVREKFRKMKLNSRCRSPPGQDDMVHVVPSAGSTKLRKIIEESQKIKNQMLEEEPEHWAQIQYCEFGERLEPRLLTNEDSVIVDGFMGQTRPGRYCMGAINHGSRKNGVVAVRTQIGKGLELTYRNGEVWVRNLMRQRPLFVDSTLRNLLKNDPKGTIYRVHSTDSPNYDDLGCIKVFDENFFQTRLEELMANPDPDIQRKETNMSQLLLQSYAIRISFIKGYGGDYPRASVWECPTWIEVIFPKAHHKIFKAITAINYVEDFLQPKEPNNVAPKPSTSNPWF